MFMFVDSHPHHDSESVNRSHFRNPMHDRRVIFVFVPGITDFADFVWADGTATTVIDGVRKTTAALRPAETKCKDPAALLKCKVLALFDGLFASLYFCQDGSVEHKPLPAPGRPGASLSRLEAHRVRERSL